MRLTRHSSSTKDLDTKMLFGRLPHPPEDGERWSGFVTAYNDRVLGRYIKPPKSPKSKVDKARTQDFAKLEKKTQLDNVEGGDLMNY